MISHPPKSPHSFSAAQVIATDEDLLAEILSRLPVRPVLRFKCVSKLWRSLISSTQFSHLHTRRYRTHVSAIFVRTSPGLVDPHYQFVPTLYDEIPSGSPFDSLNFVQDPAGIKILQSCNGLLLCCSLRKSYSRRKFYVYNPSTSQFLTLTPPLTCAANKYSTPILGLTLAFDPSKSPHYKIVCVRSSAVSVYHDQIEIYSSETRTWRSSGSAFVAPFDMVFDDGVFWNGKVHWISPTGFSALYFNVERERFGEMPRLPANESWGSRKFRYLGESGDHLHLIEIHGLATQFKVLELKKDYSEWFVKYNVDLQALVDQLPEITLNYFDHFNSISCPLVVLFLAREDHRKDKDASLFLHIPGKVISYNLKDKTFRKLCDLAPHGTQTGACSQFGLLDAYQYIETLASV